MVNEIRYTNIRRVVDSILDHPMLRDITLEQVIRYAMKFISRHGYSKFYQEKVASVEIHDWRGLLPCDCISIEQVRDMQSGLCMRSMTDNFSEGLREKASQHTKCIDLQNNMKSWYIPQGKSLGGEPTFKTNDRVIFTSFPEGMVEISYKAIPLDEDGFPLLIDNEVYLDALELYVKKQIFTIKYDQSKISSGVLQQVQQDYAVAARLLQSEFTTPSISEMESIARMWNTLIPKVREFDDGFRHLGGREYIKNH